MLFEHATHREEHLDLALFVGDDLQVLVVERDDIFPAIERTVMTYERRQRALVRCVHGQDRLVGVGRLRVVEVLFVLDAGDAQAKWLHPQYAGWVDGQLGAAMMRTGGSTVSLPKDERLRIIKVAQKRWNDRMPQACGADAAKRIEAIFAKYAG